MCNENNKNKKGFTLIELLIVIAIIGVLAATVVISLGNQTGKARDAAIKSGISSLRSGAIAAAQIDGKTGSEICNAVLEDFSVEGKGDWSWKPITGANASTTATACTRTTLTDTDGPDGNPGELCCLAKGSEWAVWGSLSDADGTGTAGNDIYCADHDGFVGSADLSTDVKLLNGILADDKVQCE